MNANASRPALNGLIPTRNPDIPIVSVFLALFIVSAVSHMRLFLRNKKAGHLFVFNAVLFGFSMSRIAACVMRIVWATRPADVDVQLVAQIFVNAGILLVYIVNLLLSMRMLRAAAPALGWNTWLRKGYKTALWLLAPMIVMFIIVIVVNVKQPGRTVARAARDVQLLGQTYFLVIAASAPLVVLPLAMLAAKRSGGKPVDGFGEGSWAAKGVVLAVTGLLALTEAGYRAGTTWEAPRTLATHGWYQSKPAFYCFNFTIDILVLAVFFVARIDKRFFVRSGANGRGSYSSGLEAEGKDVSASASETDVEAAKTEEAGSAA